MVNLKFTSTVIFLISLISCESPVTFSEPQPTGTRNISKLPNRFQGQYLNPYDSSVLTINDNLIQIVYDINRKMDSIELDAVKLSSNAIYNLAIIENGLIKCDDDSFLVRFNYIDTLFQMNNDYVIRKYKDYYFLNKRLVNKGWEVKKIELYKDELVVSDLSSQLDIDYLKKNMIMLPDTIKTHLFSASKSQFKEFVMNGGFTTRNTFVSQKK